MAARYSSVLHEPQGRQELFCFGEDPLGLIAQAEQCFLASGTAARFGDSQHLVRRHVGLHTGLGIGAEGAIATIIAAKVRERNENFSGVANRRAFEAIPNGGGGLKQRKQGRVAHQGQRVVVGYGAGYAAAV